MAKDFKVGLMVVAAGTVALARARDDVVDLGSSSDRLALPAPPAGDPDSLSAGVGPRVVVEVDLGAVV